MFYIKESEWDLGITEHFRTKDELIQAINDTGLMEEVGYKNAEEAINENMIEITED